MINNVDHHFSLTIQGKNYSSNQLLEIIDAMDFSDHSHDSNFTLLLEFLVEWFSKDHFIHVKTSGSTGKPKTIKLSKTSMIRSAQNTIDYFSLKRGSSIALVLPINYIAGKMMVVRAIVGGLNLIHYPPSCQLHTSIQQKIDFIALVPNQLHSFLKTDLNFICNAKVLLGGAPLTEQQEQMLHTHTCMFYQSYATTETASHVAIRILNKEPANEFYTALNGISFEVDKRNCLVINSEYLDEKQYQTNDVVELKNNHCFKWIGRADHIINSAGYKINPEELEKLVANTINDRFIIIGAQNDKYGEAPILIIEGKKENYLGIDLLKKINILLPKYCIIRDIYFIRHFDETPTGKIKRNLKPVHLKKF